MEKHNALDTIRIPCYIFGDFNLPHINWNLVSTDGDLAHLTCKIVSTELRSSFRFVKELLRIQLSQGFDQTFHTFSISNISLTLTEILFTITKNLWETLTWLIWVLLKKKGEFSSTKI